MIPGLLVVLLALLAPGVQTDTFGLAPTDGSAAIIVHPDGRTRSAVTVTNRTAARLVLDLAAVGATRDDHGTYSYGTAADGLGRQIALARRQVTLAAKGSATVEVTVDAPAVADPVFGAVTATAAGDDGSGVRQRLAVIVAVSRRAVDHRVGRAQDHRWLLVAGGAVVVVLGTVLAALVRRRRRPAWTR